MAKGRTKQKNAAKRFGHLTIEKIARSSLHAWCVARIANIANFVEYLRLCNAYTCTRMNYIRFK